MKDTNFRFSKISPLRFGSGCFSEIPEAALKYGKNILLITGGISFKRSGRLDQLIDTCGAAGINVYHDQQISEPSPKHIDLIVETHKDKGIDVIVSVGGGSVLDCGKAVSALLTVEGSVEDYLEGVGFKNHPGTAIPHIAVPTTSGTGSEATKNAVISKIGPNGYKKSLRHQNFIPDFVLIDPELIVDCPPDVTAACGMDAFTQLLESYVSKNASLMSDALAINGLERIVNNLELACGDRAKDLAVRGEIAFASYLSGITLANAGLGVIHGFASPLGAFKEIPHGVVCGALLAPAIEIILRELRASDPGLSATSIRKLANVGRLLHPDEINEQAACSKLVENLYKLSDNLKIETLGDYGFSETDCLELAKKSGNKYTPVELSEKHRYEILIKSL